MIRTQYLQTYGEHQSSMLESRSLELQKVTATGGGAGGSGKSGRSAGSARSVLINLFRSAVLTEDAGFTAQTGFANAMESSG